jgi:hypothetical protein
MGGLIFEHSHVTDADDSNPCVVTTKDGHKVKAQKIVLATHTPIQFNVVQTELLPYQSYVVVAKLERPTPFPKALYWDTLEFYHYIRTYEANGQTYLIVGGEDHKVGERSVDENEPFRKLEAIHPQTASATWKSRTAGRRNTSTRPTACRTSARAPSAATSTLPRALRRRAHVQRGIGHVLSDLLTDVKNPGPASTTRPGSTWRLRQPTWPSRTWNSSTAS